MGMIQEPGIYDLSEAEYHADPAPKPSLSSGVASALVLYPPKEAWFMHPRLNPDFEVEDERKYDLGTVAHELVLGKGAGIRIIEADDWRKKDTQEQRTQAIAEGKQPCLIGVYEKAQAMRTALMEQLADDPDNRDAFVSGLGFAEQSMLWKEGHRWCRSRPDWRLKDRPVIYDYKTFAGEKGADPEAFIKYIMGQARDVQDPHYSRGLGLLIDVPPEEVIFRYVVQDVDPPHLASVVEFDAATKQLAQDRWAYAFRKWSECLVSGIWPGFAARTHYVGAPVWAFAQWEEKMMAEEMLGRVQQLDTEAAE